MFRLEKAVEDWKRSLRRYDVFEDGFIADFEAHLRDAYEALRKSGLDEEAAFRAAAAHVGTADSLSAEYEKNRRVRLNRRSPLRPARFMPALARNCIKTAVRGFRKNASYAFINAFGLSVGLACCLIIMLWVQDELSYESFIPNRDRLYRVVNEVEFAGQTGALARTPLSLAPALKSEYPEITGSTRFWPEDMTLASEEKEFHEKGGWVDPDFVKMFSLEMTRGNPGGRLKDPLDILLSESAARKIFRDADPVGKTLKVDEAFVMKVAGVFRDFPGNSHLRFDALGSIEMLHLQGFPRELWANFNHPIYTYVEIDPAADAAQTGAKIERTISRHAAGVKSRLILQPLEDVHLRSAFRGDISGHGNIDYVRLSVAMGVFLLLIACFNFTNLSTAKAAGRAKEIGVRKAVGAFRGQLIGQFLGEAFGLAGAAFLAGLALARILLPEFNALASKTLEIDFLGNPPLLWGSLLILLVTGLLTGGYPAFLLSAIRPAAALKDSFRMSSSGTVFRKVLVLVQFSLSIAVTIGMMVVSTQLDFIRTKWLGFDREQLLYLSVADDMAGGLDALKAELAKHKDIVGASAASHLLTDVTHVMGNVGWEGKDPSTESNMNCLLVDESFVSTLGLKLKEGRDFSARAGDEGARPVLINETALRTMNLKDPVGKSITWGKREGLIAGVVEDFHFKPLQSAIEPMLLVQSGEEPLVLYIRINPGRARETIAFIGAAWKTLFPASAYDPRFVDEAIDEMYDNEKKIQKILASFTVLTLIISCLGLFGLASHAAEKRTKEIGIRKTLGASVPQVILLLSKEFTFWIVAANLIAWPAAYVFLRNWLRGFAYRTEMSPVLFFLAGFGALAVTWITVALRTARAALANPVQSLKYE